ncbi:hypothetical protein Tco_1418541 [Tanacetum coccineum]
MAFPRFITFLEISHGELLHLTFVYREEIELFDCTGFKSRYFFHSVGEMGEDGDIVYGASAHSHYGMITLLAADGVPGLHAIIMTLLILKGFRMCDDNVGVSTTGQHYTVLCQPGKSAILESSPSRFPPIRSGDYLRDRINAVFSS